MHDGKRLREEFGQDLQQLRAATHGLGFFCDGSNELFPVDRVDHVEQGEGVFGLVGLQRADEVEFHLRPICTQVGVFALAFLHPVLAKDHLPGFKGFDHGFNRFGLGHSDQRHVLGVARRTVSKTVDLLLNQREVLGDGHG